jgi:hypothetical protein
VSGAIVGRVRACFHDSLKRQTYRGGFFEILWEMQIPQFLRTLSSPNNEETLLLWDIHFKN